MNYKKGADVLPARLLKEIQEYAEGSLIYIPKKSDRAGWGCQSGARRLIDQRNRRIQVLFEQGEAIAEIAEKYHLSVDTIKKIIYKKK